VDGKDEIRRGESWCMESLKNYSSNKSGLRACSKDLTTKRQKDYWIPWRRVERIRSKALD